MCDWGWGREKRGIEGEREEEEKGRGTSGQTYRISLTATPKVLPGEWEEGHEPGKAAMHQGPAHAFVPVLLSCLILIVFPSSFHPGD